MGVKPHRNNSKRKNHPPRRVPRLSHGANGAIILNSQIISEEDARQLLFLGLADVQDGQVAKQLGISIPD